MFGNLNPGETISQKKNEWEMKLEERKLQNSKASSSLTENRFTKAISPLNQGIVFFKKQAHAVQETLSNAPAAIISRIMRDCG